MKRIVLILALFSCMFSFAQSAKGKSAVIEYQIYNNTDLPNTLNATLYIDNKSTIYFERYSTKRNMEAKDADPNSETIPPRYVFEPYTKYDHGKKQILLFESINTNTVLVSDTYNDLKWQITEEQKEIAGFACIKATTSYRGRDWTAWFTPEIAMPYGPWKLHGLPGLILETYDATNMYTIRATKIEFKRDAIWDKDFTKLYDHKNSEPMTYQQFFNDTEEYLANTRAKMLKNNPNIKYTPQPRKGKELTYEWEQ